MFPKYQREFVDTRSFLCLGKKQHARINQEATFIYYNYILVSQKVVRIYNNSGNYLPQRP